MKKLFLLLCIFSTSFVQAIETEKPMFILWPECVKITIANHPELKAAREKILEYKIDKKIRRSNFFPQLNATASIGKSSEIPTENISNNYSYGLSARQLVFDGFISSTNMKIADAEIEQQHYNYFIQESNIIFNCRQAFIQLLKNQEYIDIYKSLYKRRKSNFDLVNMRYKAGREHRGSLLAAEADRDKAHMDMKASIRNYNLQKKILLNQMGNPVFTKKWNAKGNFSISQNMKIKPEWDLLFQRNPLLNKMIAQSKAKYYSTELSYGSYYPQVYAFLNAGTNGGSSITGENKISGGVEFTLPLFEGGSTYYNVKKNKSQYQQAKIEEESVKNSIMITLEQTRGNCSG